MKILISILGLGFLFSAHAAEPTIVGVWHLDRWTVRAESGEESEFCKGAGGILMYEESGYVSTSINCPKKNDVHKEPADDYQRVFFYAGTYTLKSGTIYKVVANATFLPLIGKTVPRKIEKLTDDELILSGPFGPKGTLWVRWTRLNP